MAVLCRTVAPAPAFRLQGITNRIDGEEPVILQVVEAMRKAGYHFEYRILNPG